MKTPDPEIDLLEMLWLGPPHSMHESKVHGGEDLLTKLILCILMNRQFVCRGILNASIYVRHGRRDLNGGDATAPGRLMRGDRGTVGTMMPTKQKRSVALVILSCQPVREAMVYHLCQYLSSIQSPCKVFRVSVGPVCCPPVRQQYNARATPIHWTAVDWTQKKSYFSVTS